MGEGKYVSEKKLFSGREGFRVGKRPKLSASTEKSTGDI